MSDSLQLFGLEKNICKPVELEGWIVEKILLECGDRQKMQSWIKSLGLEGCISQANGPLEALQKMHDHCGSDVSPRGKIYLGHCEAADTSEIPNSNFTGTFGKPVFWGFQNSESNIPKFVKRHADFVCGSESRNSYRMVWSRKMVRPISSESKRMNVARIEEDRDKHGVQTLIFYCNGGNPFLDCSANTIVSIQKAGNLEETQGDAIKNEPNQELACVLGTHIVHNASDICIMVYRLSNYCDYENHESAILPDGNQEADIEAINQLIQVGKIGIFAQEEAVSQPDLHLYRLFCNNCSKTEGDNADINITDHVSETVLDADQAGEPQCEFNPGPATYSPDLVVGNELAKALFVSLQDDKREPQDIQTSGNRNAPSPPVFGEDVVSELNIDGCGINSIAKVSARGTNSAGSVPQNNLEINTSILEAEVFQKLLAMLPFFYKYLDHAQCEDNAMFIAKQVREHIDRQYKINSRPIDLDSIIPALMEQIKRLEKPIREQGGLLFLAIGVIMLLTERWQKQYGIEGCIQNHLPKKVDVETPVQVRPSKDPLPESDVFMEHEKEFFFQLRQEDIGGFLLDALEENRSSVGPYLHKIAHEYDMKVIWELLNKAKREHMQHDRSLGGHFLKLIKFHKNKEDVAKEVSKASRIAQPLRNYQRKAVDIATENWTPRSDSKECHNFAIVAPTGSGKTAIFIECARFALEKEQHSKIVVIVPTVPLTKQHEGAFQANGFEEKGWPVESFSSENPLSKVSWPSVLQHQSVMIMTAQVFLNLLDERAAKINQIDLLVLDEFHHTKSNSPYKKIMDHYTEAFNNIDMYCPKVIGFSASPTCGNTIAKVYSRLMRIKMALKANIIYIDDNNAEILATVPTPEERIVRIAACKEDVKLKSGVANFVERTKKLIEVYLAQELLPGVESTTASSTLLRFFNQDNAERANEFLNSEAIFRNLASNKLSDLKSCTSLLVQCTNSLQYLNEFGHRSALAHCAVEWVRIVEEAPKGADLLRELVYQFCRTVPISEGSFITGVFGTGAFACQTSFPKFMELIKFLDVGYVSVNAQFHGIIFTETRAGVYHLAKLLRQIPKMKSVEFLEFMGHGAAKNAIDAKNKGMSGKQQETTLQIFRKPGMKVLVATSAAEEGLDIADCEFVVRYSAPKTGIQRVQSKGRSRKGGVFLSLVVEDTVDEKLETKSKVEETLLAQVLRDTKTIRIK